MGGVLVICSMEHLDMFARFEPSDEFGQVDTNGPRRSVWGSSYRTNRDSHEQSTWSFPCSS